MRGAREQATSDLRSLVRDGRRVAVVGERGSGRTTLVRGLADEVRRGTGLRLLDAAGFALATATRGAFDAGAGDPLTAVLVVEDVQWADEETVSRLAGVTWPLVVTCLPGNDDVLARLRVLEQVQLPPLDDDEAGTLLERTDESRLRRAGGNLRLLVALDDPAQAGRVRRTLEALLEPLGPEERRLVLWLGVAAGPLPLPTSPARDALVASGHLRSTRGGWALRIGALGELAAAGAVPTDRADAEGQVAALLPEAEAAPHLLAAGDPARARSVALQAVRAGGLDDATTADLLLLAERATGQPLEDELVDARAEALWRCWRLDELLETDPATPAQRRVVALARTARGQLPSEAPPAGTRRRTALARDGALVETADDQAGDDGLDGQLARALSGLVRGDPVAVEARGGDPEQRWQAGALEVLAAVLDGSDPSPALEELRVLTAPTPRWATCTRLLAGTVDVLRDGPTPAALEGLASALAQVPAPTPAWATAVLALGHAQRGDAREAADLIATARSASTSAADQQVTALVLAECELLTGRPRRALRALQAPAWPVLDPVLDLLRAVAQRTVGEPADGPRPEVPALRACAAASAEHGAQARDDADGLRAAGALWEPVSRPRALHCRWAAADADVRHGRPDVAALRALEQEAGQQQLLPLLGRVRETLRRTGERPRRDAVERTDPAGPHALTPRELEVLALVREGLTTPQVATRLGVAVSTVETQLASSMRKLGARTRHHAVALLGQVP